MYRLLSRMVAGRDSGRAYRLACRSVGLLHALSRFSLTPCGPPRHPVQVMGLEFPNPVGLAAGFDRDGGLLEGLASTGFGFVEVGTINPPPGEAVARSLESVAANLRDARARHRVTQRGCPRQLLGISLGSTRKNPGRQAAEEFLAAMDMLWEHADYLVVNLSRPGGPGRDTGGSAPALRALLARIKAGHEALTAHHGARVPITVKVAVDDERERKLPLAVGLAVELGFDGVVATFEGWECRARLLERVGEIAAFSQPLSLVVVGGIESAEAARERLHAGASLVQLYTGLVRQGPLLPGRIAEGLERDRAVRKQAFSSQA